jgi:hypothetical protein
MQHQHQNPLGLTEPQWIGIALMLLGTVGWVYYARFNGPPQPTGRAAR